MLLILVRIATTFTQLSTQCGGTTYGSKPEVYMLPVWIAVADCGKVAFTTYLTPIGLSVQCCQAPPAAAAAQYIVAYCFHG